VRSQFVRRRTIGVRWLALVALGLAAAFGIGGGGAGAAPPCDKVASLRGLDINPGTEALPFRTAEKLAGSLGPGQTGCLRGGTYSGNMVITHGGTSGAPISIQSYPGERAVVIGRVWVQSGADFVTVSDLDLVGLNPLNGPSPLIEANDVTLANNDITNIHTADCVFIGSWAHVVERVAITGNRIHNCGRIPITNRHQGISVWNAGDTKISRNVIFDNADRGIQLFPYAQRTQVDYNTIDGNGEGVLVSGTDTGASNDNIVERNVITNSTNRDNLESFWPEGGPVGTGNVYRDNCVSGGVRDNGDGGVQPRMAGVVVSGNLVADPGYVDRIGKDFSLSPGSPCLAPISGLVWRPFRDDSLWNEPAGQKGDVTGGNPYADQFSSQSLEISGIPNGGGSGIRYAKPIYFAKPGDPVASVDVGKPDWISAPLDWDGKPIPVPDGVAPAPGSDGHLTIVSADRKTAWDMWRATQAGTSGYVTEVIAQWDLTGSGVASPSNNSARGSGAPVIPSTLRAQEALHGINHALGITVPSVSSDYVFPPASHSDGHGGPDAIKYGMLFVLRPDYPVPANAGVGERNVIQALKTYGAYVVDQGASLELDADSNDAAGWAESGLGAQTLGIQASDFRFVNTAP
jgi:Right handed beta helix region